MRHFSRLSLVRFVVLTCFLAAGPLYAASSTGVEDVLNRIDSKEYVLSITGETSDAPTAGELARHFPEVKYLVANREKAIPQMIERWKRPEGIRNESTKIVYFIVFENSRDWSTIPLIADYLDSLPDSQRRNSEDFDNSPFQYAYAAAGVFIQPAAAQALQDKYKSAIASGQMSKTDIFTIRHEVANTLRIEYKRRAAAKTE